jgi:hypothetical protein
MTASISSKMQELQPTGASKRKKSVLKDVSGLEKGSKGKGSGVGERKSAGMQRGVEEQEEEEEEEEEEEAEEEEEEVSKYIVWVINKRGRTARTKRAWPVSLADWREFKWALENDMQGNIKTKSLALATEAEDQLAAELAACGIKFWTEEDIRLKISLKREKLQLKGAPSEKLRSIAHLTTPDVVFRDKLLIEGRTTRWLDVKNFYLPMSAGAASSTRVERMVKQAERYNEEWGSGAFVFKYGYCETLKTDMKDVAGVLDGSFLSEPDQHHADADRV